MLPIQNPAYSFLACISVIIFTMAFLANRADRRGVNVAAAAAFSGVWKMRRVGVVGIQAVSGVIGAGGILGVLGVRGFRAARGLREGVELVLRMIRCFSANCEPGKVGPGGKTYWECEKRSPRGLRWRFRQGAWWQSF
jgi:hypothetical protein